MCVCIQFYGLTFLRRVSTEYCTMKDPYFESLTLLVCAINF